MLLNDLLPAVGAKKKRKRLGRGHASTLGKTCGKGHKGQKARSGWSAKLGFEGGQMPYRMRLPKFGFTSKKSLTRAEIRLSEINKITAEVIDLAALKAANIVNDSVTTAKIISSGKLERKVSIKGLGVTKGAKEAIIALGGTIEE